MRSHKTLPGVIRSPRLEVMQESQIVAVVASGLIAGVEPQLLIDREAGDRHAADRAGGEAVPEVLEVAAVDVGLEAVAVGVEGNGVEIDPAAGLGDEFDADGTPVGLHDEAEGMEGFYCCRFVVGVDGEVEVPMGPGLATSQRVDAPAAADPGSTAGVSEGVKHGKDV
jgi:hypothetical protein